MEFISKVYMVASRQNYKVLSRTDQQYFLCQVSWHPLKITSCWIPWQPEKECQNVVQRLGEERGCRQKGLARKRDETADRNQTTS